MTYGYARVSTNDQELDQQIEALGKEGVKSENIFFEKISTRKTARPELARLLAVVKEGDLIIIYALDRLARSLIELVRLTNELIEKKVGLKAIRDKWLDTSRFDDPVTRFTFNIFASLAEFERDLIRMRTNEGIKTAQSKGVVFGRKQEVTEEQIVLMKDQYKQGVSYMELGRLFGRNVKTIRKYIIGENQ